MNSNWGQPLTMHTDAVATGNGKSLPISDRGGAAILIKGAAGDEATFTATITFEGSMDGGTTWYSVRAVNMASGTPATTATTAGNYFVTAPGVGIVRARISAYTSGSLNVIGVPAPCYAPA